MVSKLQSLTALWQEFDLLGTQKLLDDLATDITARQDDSDASKKLLIELMRSFKKNNSEDTRHAVAPLLKSFQNEVDSLSKRSKAAEKAFFDIYKKFCDITDPVPTLEYCMETQKSLQKMQDMEIEIKQLRETIGDYNTEIQEYKVKEKKLEEMEVKVDEYETNYEETINDKVKEKEEELNKEFEDKVKNFEEEKIMIGQKLVDSEQKYKVLQNHLEECQNELFDLKSKGDEKREAASDEIEMLMTDLDRANSRAHQAEKEVSLLQEKIQEMKKVAHEDDLDSEINCEEVAGLRTQLHAKEREVVQLVEDVQKCTKQLQDVETREAKRIADLEAALDEKQRMVSSLEGKLSRQEDYDSIKKDLSILKSLEFSCHEEASGGEDNRPLEVLILERSKALQTENSMLRLDKERMSQEIRSLKGECESQESQISRQSELIEQLEDHVEQLQTISTPFREEAEGRSSSDILAEALQLENIQDEEKCMSPPPSQDSSSALLPIVAAQRERFRARNEELEKVEQEQQQQINLLSQEATPNRGEATQLRQDNAKLYEKMRYLQSCGSGGRGQGGDTHVQVESRYRSNYEQKLDPFSSFSQAEKQRKYGQLSVFEKIILSMVRFMVGNKTARLAMFAYFVLLHGLVFLVLSRLAWTDSCRRENAAEWHERYMEHMQVVHGEEGHQGGEHHGGEHHG